MPNIVYVAKNRMNGKKYVGVTTYSLAHRKSCHKRAASKVDSKFYRAIRKYGFDNFKWKVVKSCKDADSMFSLEKRLVEKWDTINHGYNTVPGGDKGVLGLVWTSRQRKRASTAQRKRFKSRKERKHISQAVREWAKTHPEKVAAHKAKMIEVLRSSSCRKAQSRRMKQFATDNPDVIACQARSRRKTFAENPDIAVRISRNLGGRPIKVYRDGKHITTYATQHEAARKLGVNVGNIQLVLTGKRSHTGGYSFDRA